MQASRLKLGIGFSFSCDKGRDVTASLDNQDVTNNGFHRDDADLHGSIYLSGSQTEQDDICGLASRNEFARFVKYTFKSKCSCSWTLQSRVGVLTCNATSATCQRGSRRSRRNRG